MKENERIGSYLIGSLIALALLIKISMDIFGVFLILTPIIFLIWIIVFIYEFNNEGEIDENSISYILSIMFLGCVVILFLSYSIGYGIGSTPIGEASLEVFTALNLVKQKTTDTMNQAISESINESCEQLPEKNCQDLRSMRDDFETVQDVINMANKIKRLKK